MSQVLGCVFNACLPACHKGFQLLLANSFPVCLSCFLAFANLVPYLDVFDKLVKEHVDNIQFDSYSARCGSTSHFLSKFPTFSFYPGLACVKISFNIQLDTRLGGSSFLGNMLHKSLEGIRTETKVVFTNQKIKNPTQKPKIQNKKSKLC